MQDALEQRIGDVVGFFVHRTFVDPGANCQFTVVNIRFGRIVQVDFTGSPTTRPLVPPAGRVRRLRRGHRSGRAPYMTVGRVRLVR